MRAACLVIGNEILTGKIRDANSPVLAHELRQNGIELVRIEVVPDDVPCIAEAIQRIAPQVDLLFTSGGVGPTPDDVTVEAVAVALGVPVVIEPTLEQWLRDFYQDRLTEHALRMARVPQGSSLVSAGGLSFPALQCRNLIILPGVPQMFADKVRHLARSYAGQPWYIRRIYLNAVESDLAPAMEELVAELPDVALGSYPEFFSTSHQVLVTLESRDAERVEAALERFLSCVPGECVLRVE